MWPVSRFLRILKLIMLLAHSSYGSALISTLGGGSIRAFTFELRHLEHWAIFMVGDLGLAELSVVLSHVVILQSDVHVI